MTLRFWNEERLPCLAIYSLSKYCLWTICSLWSIYFVAIWQQCLFWVIIPRQFALFVFWMTHVFYVLSLHFCCKYSLLLLLQACFFLLLLPFSNNTCYGHIIQIADVFLCGYFTFFGKYSLLFAANVVCCCRQYPSVFSCFTQRTYFTWSRGKEVGKYGNARL